MSRFGYAMAPYFVNMPAIGAPLNDTNEENKTELKKIETAIREKAAAAVAAGRPDEAINASGQLTVMQRLRYLVDAGSWCELNSILNPEDNPDGSTGWVTGLGKIHDKWTMIIASDNKKLAGAWVAGMGPKLTRATDIAKALNIPLVYVLNCSGIKLDVQDKVFAARHLGGSLFYRHTELEQLGIPVIVGIFGTNPAGGGYHAISPHILIAHEKANMAVGGNGIMSGMNPKGYVDEEAALALINATKNGKKQSPPGSMEVHHKCTGFVREVYGEEEGVLDAIKKYIDASPAYESGFFRVDDPKEPRFPVEDLYTLIPLNQRRVYDVRNVLARLVDNSEFYEFKKDYGPEVICGMAKVDGLLCGMVANYQGFIMGYPEYREKGSVGLGGKLYRQGLAKMNEFVTLCGRDRIPIVWFQDTAGIDVGDPAEKAELLGLGQSLIYSIQSSKVPQLEVSLRKSSGAAFYVMGGPQGNDTNVMTLGTAATEIYVMHGETAAAAQYARRLVKDKDAGKDIQPIMNKMNAMIQDYLEKSRPEYCAKVGYVDEIVNLSELRKYLQAFINAAYQNPRSMCPFHQMYLPRAIREWDEYKAGKK